MYGMGPHCKSLNQIIPCDGKRPTHSRKHYVSGISRLSDVPSDPRKVTDISIETFQKWDDSTAM
jgi:hypothetical protein